MFRRIYRVVLRTYDEADATREIKEDWHRDAKGSERLGRVGFCDALFELADMWTAGICPYEYAAFRATTAPHPPLFLRLSSSSSLPPPPHRSSSHVPTRHRVISLVASSPLSSSTHPLASGTQPFSSGCSSRSSPPPLQTTA